MGPPEKEAVAKNHRCSNSSLRQLESHPEILKVRAVGVPQLCLEQGIDAILSRRRAPFDLIPRHESSVLPFRPHRRVILSGAWGTVARINTSPRRLQKGTATGGRYITTSATVPRKTIGPHPPPLQRRRTAGGGVGIVKNKILVSSTEGEFPAGIGRSGRIGDARDRDDPPIGWPNGATIGAISVAIAAGDRLRDGHNFDFDASMDGRGFRLGSRKDWRGQSGEIFTIWRRRIGDLDGEERAAEKGKRLGERNENFKEGGALITT